MKISEIKIYLRKFIGKIRNVFIWFGINGDILLMILGLIIQTKGATILSGAVFPIPKFEVGGEGWSTNITGFNSDIYKSGIYFLIYGLIIQILALIISLINRNIIQKKHQNDKTS